MAEIDYTNLFQSIPGLYLILRPDKDFTIIEVSDQYAQATMTRRDEIMGKGLFEVFPDNPDDPGADGVSNLRASLNYLMRNKSSHTMAIQKYDIRRPDGTFEERFWNPLNQPVLNAGGKISFIVHRVDDVTDFVNLKKEQTAKDQAANDLREKLGQMEIEVYNHLQQLQKVNKELTKTNQELDSFTDSVSHDLRAPLRAINGYARMLEEEYSGILDEEASRLLNNIKSNIRRMGNLIDDLLTFSKLNKKELRKSETNIPHLVESVIHDIEKGDKHKASVIIGTMHDAPADSSLISQVFMNLVSNAIKYSSTVSNPEILISSEKNSDEVVYSVRDNGVGFNMEYSDKLFGVFQRLHHFDEFEGTGIGLAIVKRIVERHGGKVWANGKLGEGAVFSFSLPLSQSEA